MKLTVVLALACGFIAAPLIAVGTASGSPTCDNADCVPFVARNVAPGAPCVSSTAYVFGLDASSGRTLVCAQVGLWVPARPLIGVRTLGAPCDGNPGLAQAPDGLPMACNGTGWVGDYTEIFFPKLFGATESHDSAALPQPS